MPEFITVLWSHDYKMADDAPPVYEAVPESLKARYTKIKQKFQEKYGCEPEFYARAPGRVNIIGEHIDYCGYGVLPMAIEQDIVIAVAKNNDSKLVLANVDNKYSEYECSIKDYSINKDKPDWYNYFLCGLRGMTEMLELDSPVGMYCMVDGCVPCSAGLSSSSALVCCAALATMYANGQTRTKRAVADMCAKCEQYIGTIGGGMDQAISFMAQSGTAKKIDFNPLRDQDVRVPDGVAFVISNCCTEKNKAASNDFNTRVVECRLAAQIIAKSKGLAWQEYKRLADVQTKLGAKLQDMVELVKAVLHTEPYSKTEVCEVLGVSADELANLSLSANTLHVETFRLQQRALHVYIEASRVEEYHTVCNTMPAGAVERLGQLMNDSHHSCSQMYECSCTELDELVNLCVASGSLGSRLTGAGWGGCAVSMVPSSEVGPFLEKVKQGYYIPRGLQDRVDQSLFATKPGSGAAVYKA